MYVFKPVPPLFAAIVFPDQIPEVKVVASMLVADKAVEEENMEVKALETIRLVVEAVPETDKAVDEA